MNGVNYEPLLRTMTWSFSRLNSYRQCPCAWYLHYLMEEEEEECFYSSFGSFCHELIARFYTGELTRDELLPEFLQGFSLRVLGERPSADAERKYLDQGAEYFENFEEFPLETVFVEQKKDFQVGNVKMTGIIDYLGRDSDGGLILVDHKSADLKARSTNGKRRASDQKLDDTLRQLYLYGTAVRDAFGEFPKELWLNCFRTGNLIREPFDEGKYEEAARWAEETVEKICRDSDFLPTDDYYYCRWICGVRHACDLYEEEYGKGRRRA